MDLDEVEEEEEEEAVEVEDDDGKKEVPVSLEMVAGDAFDPSSSRTNWNCFT